MTINASDIKLLESERMADTTDGGGRRTSRVVPDGVAGNIFPKVSRLDSVYGRVNLRKVFGAVQTAGVDTYAGAHAVITDAPDNAKIHTTLFSTASEFDTRAAARDRIESYVTSGPESRMILLGRQLAGQQSIVAYQRTEEPLPEIGEVFCLSSEAGQTVTAYQYFRVQSVESEVRTFTESLGSGYVDFKRRVVTIGTGVPLRYDFTGPETPTQNSAVARPSKLRTTTVVDAARYFGIRPLSEVANAAALTVKVDSVYTPIVPTTNRETPLSNANMGGAINIIPAKAATVSEAVSLGAQWAVGATLYTRRPILPGSLSVSGSGVTATTDDKLGTIGNATFSATVDYENGTITRTGGSASATSYTLTYQPAGIASQVSHTADEQITLGNRGTVYTYTLNPLPTPGSVYVDYRALGKWYRLRDNGAGELKGADPAYGVGSVDYSTGAVVLTLGALPDVGSSIMRGWGGKLHYAIRADGTSDAGTSVKQRITLPDVPVLPNSFSMTYTSDGTQYTAADDANGVITGNGVTGKISYTDGVVDIEYTTRLPDSSSAVACQYAQVVPADPQDEVAMSKSEPASASIALGTAVVPGSFNGSVPMAGGGLAGHVFISDNGAGLIVAKGGQTLQGSATANNARTAADQIIGSINYAAGTVTITNGVVASGSFYKPVAPRYLGDRPPAVWEAQERTLSVSVGTASYGWKDSGVSATDAAKTYDAAFIAAPLRIDLTRTTAEKLVPGSIMLSAAGKYYIDRNGALYADVSNLTGAGTLAGSINYDNGEASLSLWDDASPSIAVLSAATTYGTHTEYELFFRTAGAPIRPGSFYVQATAEDGTLLSASSNDSGVISGVKVSGTVDQETGVVRLLFGQMVAAAGNESEWWYDASGVVGGMVFKPTLIIPSTLAYNAVVVANLPLNADLLGLDPVRLPMDGRVPVFRPADVVVIHNTQSFALPNPAVAGATYSVGRTDLSELWLVDQAGARINGDQYSVSLEDGSVTMSASLSLGGAVQPLIAKHRVEELALLSDVQINGQLTVSAPLSRQYPAGSSFVSSALLFGDMNARVVGVHDLLAFSAWSDTPGQGAAAQYNDIDYPIEVLNNGALTERWRINFTNATTFQVIGENLGVIATGSVATDCAPTNQLTGNPYFVIRAAGWGAGWSAGNQLRFNTVGAAAPIWIARTILPGASLEGDSFSLQMRGDVDAE